MTDSINISVIIVSDSSRFHYISRCLDALSEQNIRTKFEVLLVISGERNIDLNRWISKGLNVKVVPADDNNYCLKRNIGAKAARGDIIAYIDDDATASPEWVNAIAKGFKHDWKMAGGRVEPIFEVEIPNSLKSYERLIGGFNYLPGSEYSTSTILGCNMFFKSRWLLGTGGFDEYIGKMNSCRPKVFHGGDEIDILERAKSKNVGFIKEAHVDHEIQKSRLNRRYIISRAYGNGRVKKYIDNKYKTRSINIFGLIKKIVKNIFELQPLKSRKFFAYLFGYILYRSRKYND